MRQFLIFVFVVFVAVPGRAGSAKEVVLRRWTKLVGEHGFGEVLAAVMEEPTLEWPAVHSADCPAAGPLDAACRDWADKLLEGMQGFEPGLRDLPQDEFVSRAGAMLALRDRVVRHPSYVNLLLADVLNRCVAANVGARLVREPRVEKGLLGIQEQLARYTVSPESLVAVTMDELGLESPPPDFEDATTDFGRLSALWNFLEPGVPVGWPGSHSSVDAASMLQSRNLLGLACRLVGTDTLIHTHLPSLVLYRERVHGAPRGASYREIKAALGEKTPAPESLGTLPYGIRRAASAVSELEQEVESGKIWIRPAFTAEQILNWHNVRQDGNFVAAFDAQWRAGNPSDILAFTEANVATNPSVETLFARAVAAAYVQKWARGATNFLGQAMTMAQGDASLSPVGRSNVVHLLEETKSLFEALADDSNEPRNSVPQWDAAMHAVVFGELGGQAPFLATLQQIAATK